MRLNFKLKGEPTRRFQEAVLENSLVVVDDVGDVDEARARGTEADEGRVEEEEEGAERRRHRRGRLGLRQDVIHRRQHHNHPGTLNAETSRIQVLVLIMRTNKET